MTRSDEDPLVTINLIIILFSVEIAGTWRISTVTVQNTTATG
jgi:hypothetical protein